MTTLWDQPASESTADLYARWRLTKDGERVYGYCLGKAMALRRAGRDRVSFRSIWESARLELILIGETVAGRSLQDHFAPYMSRELMRSHRDLAGLFETRSRKDAA